MNSITLQNAIEQIKSLREQNKIMKTRLQMFDDMMLLFKARQPEYGMESYPDIVKDLEYEMMNMQQPLSKPMAAINPDFLPPNKRSKLD